MNETDMIKDMARSTATRAYNTVSYVIENTENKVDMLKDMIEYEGFEIIGDKVVIDANRFFIGEIIRDANDEALSQYIEQGDIDAVDYFIKTDLMASLKQDEIKRRVEGR